MHKTNRIIWLILLIGILFRIELTENGNFLFHIDSARDFVDIREMVELNKLRLTGPTTPIDGLYDGPFWYYLLAIPYIISRGDPYSAILLQIVLWAIGGFFLLKLVKNLSEWAIIPTGFLWVASNYIVLASTYSFNPTPVMLLTPVFIYLLVEYLKTRKGKFIIMAWFLAGMFFNFEMNFGVFTPIIIFLSLILTKNMKLFKSIYFWIGAFIFIATLLPQILFDLRHQFIMSKALAGFLIENKGAAFNPLGKIYPVLQSFYNTFLPTMMNQKILVISVFLLSIPVFKKFLFTGKKDVIIVVSLLYVLIPFTGYLIIPVTINPWHLGGPMAALLILIAFIIYSIRQSNLLGKIFSISLSIVLVLYAISNILNYFINDRRKPNMDPSLFKNEIAAIDFIYRKAEGKNFKVYAYLPSIIDYPYQYLIWWHGLKRFGYLPEDYAYAPNKPQYIPGKASFSATEAMLKLRENSNLVFLIKEPNRNYTRYGWEGDFIKYNWEFIEKQMVGPIEVEIRKE